MEYIKNLLMINLKHLKHIVTWGYSVALLNVTIMLHLKKKLCCLIVIFI